MKTPNDYKKERLHLIDIWKETRKISNREFYADTERLKTIDTIPYLTVPVVAAKRTQPAIKFVNGGTVSTGYEYSKKGRTAILNFADAVKPCGWVEEGAPTQEENICRCTNLYETLTSEFCAENYYNLNKAQIKGQYYNTYTDALLYAKNVVVFRDDTDYHFLEPRQFDVITCPAPSMILSATDALELYLRRITRIVTAAIHQEAKNIILGAWGCGAFGQDPYQVAKGFALVLNEYAGHFDNVVFAIRSTVEELEQFDDTAKQFKLALNQFYKGEVING